MSEGKLWKLIQIAHDAMEALGDPNGHITGCPARLDGPCAQECADIRTAINFIRYERSRSLTTEAKAE